MLHLSIALSLASVLCVAAAGCATSSPRSSASTHPACLRVLTYNIHHGAGSDDRIDLNRIAAVINRANPDLVALQEVDVNTRRSGSVDQARELGRLTKLTPYFGQAINFEGGGYGQAILCRFPLESFRVEHLPDLPNAEPQIAIIATIVASDGRPSIAFTGVHLDHRGEAGRIPQARRLAELTDQTSAELSIVAGDFNATPDSETMKAFASRWTSATGPDAASHPADAPKHKIDWILFRGDGWRIVKARVIDEADASDHRPVFAEFEHVPASEAPAK